MKKEKRDEVHEEEEIKLYIPDDEIWDYQVEGLAKPHINKPYSHYTLKKIVFTVVIVIAVALSVFFSVRTIQKETFEYKEASVGYEFTKFSNTGVITELEIDYVSSVKYDTENPDPETNFSIVKDKTKPITEVGPYTLNCDEKVKTIYIGAGVEKIDPKAFYSCWALREIKVDENNPNYCDIEGVLYSKDKSVIICRPTDHDTYLAEKYGYAVYDKNNYRIEPNEEGFPISDKEIKPFPAGKTYDDYVKDVLTYVVPSSVKTVGELSFNYANMKNVYLPEGLEKIETLGFFEIPLLENVYTYKTGEEVTSPHLDDVKALGEIYISLPEGLTYIGSDAFSYNQAMNYIYIPDTVTFIGHHAFWDTVYKDKDSGELKGVTVINTPLSEDEFKQKVEVGDNWKPQYDYMLFKKSIDTNYGATRENMK